MNLKGEKNYRTHFFPLGIFAQTLLTGESHLRGPVMAHAVIITNNSNVPFNGTCSTKIMFGRDTRLRRVHLATFIKR